MRLFFVKVTKVDVAERIEGRVGEQKSCQWFSHYVPYQTDYTSKFSWVVGKEFNHQHEIWSHVRPGDSLAVLSSISPLAWSSRGQEAYLFFDTFYDP